MATNNSNQKPIFTNVGQMIPIHVAVANTASDGSGTLNTLVTATTDGTRIDGIQVRNGQTTNGVSSAMVIRVFLTNASGANPRLINEFTLAAATRTATAIGANTVATFSPALVLASGQILSVVQSVYAGVQDQNSYLAYAGNF